jgi:hypothetical protein
MAVLKMETGCESTWQQAASCVRVHAFSCTACVCLSRALHAHAAALHLHCAAAHALARTCLALRARAYLLRVIWHRINQRGNIGSGVSGMARIVARRHRCERGKTA